MYTTLHLHQFRGFRRLEMSGLSVVNLLVGGNNVGKSSVLEAFEMLAWGGRFRSLQESLLRRGEVEGGELLVNSLFYGYQLRLGMHFEVRGAVGDGTRFVRCEAEQRGDLPILDPIAVTALHLLGTDQPSKWSVPLDVQGRLNLSNYPSSGVVAKVEYIDTAPVSHTRLQKMWLESQLRREDDRVVEVLRLVAPQVERVVVTDATVLLLLQGAQDPVPLGSFGEGTRRLLGLALPMARVAGGLLLVDEIDTGLHYTALKGLWKWLIEAARRLNVQVVATSHSGDCLRALARLHEEDPALAADVSVHRIDPGVEQTMPYTAEELYLAVQGDAEVRGR